MSTTFVRAWLVVPLACLLQPCTGACVTFLQCDTVMPPDSTTNFPLTGGPPSKIVYIHFPGQPDEYPTWIDSFDASLLDALGAYLKHWSCTRYQPVFQVLARPGSGASRTWEAPNTLEYYQGLPNAPDALIADVNAAIEAEWGAIPGAPPPWQGVYGRIFLIDGCVQLGTCLRGQQNGTTIWMTLIPGPNPERTQTELPYRVLGGLLHEFGHLLRLEHPEGAVPIPPGAPATCPVAPLPEVVNYGRYDLMRQPGDGLPPDNGVPAYGPTHLTRLGWVSEQVVTREQGSQTLRIPPIRRFPDASVARVLLSDPRQQFLLANYAWEQSSGIDDLYEGYGLLIWHEYKHPNGLLLKPLESAVGKYLSGVPDPVLGSDPLEENWCYRGSGADFFGREPLHPGEVVPRDFAGDTNPSSRLHVRSYESEPGCAEVEFRNIRRDEVTSDMLVDVSWLSLPIHEVSFPNGGEVFAGGQVVHVTWLPAQGVPSVDIYLSQLPFGVGNSVVWNLLSQSAPNTGTASVVMPAGPIAGLHRLWLVSSTGSCETYDSSDETFLVWKIVDDVLFTENVTQWCVGSASRIKFDISWITTLNTGGPDSLLIYVPGPCGGTTPRIAMVTPLVETPFHHVAWEGRCVGSGTWRYTVSSTKVGVGTNRLTCRTKVVTCTSCYECEPDCLE